MPTQLFQKHFWVNMSNIQDFPPQTRLSSCVPGHYQLLHYTQFPRETWASSLPLAAPLSFIYKQTWPKPFHSTSDNYITFFQGLFCHHCLLGPSLCHHSCRSPSITCLISPLPTLAHPTLTIQNKWKSSLKMNLRSIHVSANGTILFLFMVE